MTNGTWSVRSRVLTVAGVVLVAALALSAGLFLWVLDGALERSAHSHATNQAAEVSRLLQAGAPDEVVRRGDSRRAGDVVVQVLAGDRVLAASEADAATRPLTDRRPAPGRESSTRVDHLDGIDDDAFVVVTRGTTTAAGDPVVVMVASPVHVEEGEVFRNALIVGLAVAGLLAVSLVVVRWAVGASLAPVEQMRQQLAARAGHDGEHVDVPPTGDELERLGTTMNDLLRRLDAAYAAQRAFVSDASHELRNPLATLRLSVDVGGRDPSGASWAASRDAVAEEVRRLEALVDDLLVLSRSDADALQLERVDCDLDDLVVAEVARARPGARVPIEVTARPVRVQGDPQRLAQVVSNLLTNAVRHARSGVRVEVTDDARVRVDNDGPVVPAAEREAIFRRFVRLDEARGRDSGGTGLGLSIARDLAEAHGGTLVCGEADDGWCRFELSLPR